MSWKDKVPSCFGEADIIFAGHPLDEARAKATIKDAKAAGASFGDFEKEVARHCNNKIKNSNLLKGHTDAQVAKAKGLWK